VDVDAGNDGQATPFYIACQEGHVDVVSLLLVDKRIDVNKRARTGATPLHIACERGHTEVVSVLLADQRIDVNTPDHNGATPFFIACQQGHKEVVSMLMADKRVDVNYPLRTGTSPFKVTCSRGHQDLIWQLLNDERVDTAKPDSFQCTPLWMASQNGRLLAAQLIFVSEREVDTKTKSIAGDSPWNNKTAAEIAHRQGVRDKLASETEEDFTRRKQNGHLIASLIASFDLDPVATRQQLRELPGVRDFISDLFALVIFLCDDLLTEGAESSPSSSSAFNNNKAARFFQVAQLLPMELQMALCNRVFGSCKDIILTKHSEPAFQKLGKLLARAESL